MAARYQSTKEGEYWRLAAEKPFKSMRAAHLAYMIIDSQQKNPLFRSPMPDTAKHILDIDAGNGTCPVETADKYPSLCNHAIDLSPPTNIWASPNCVFEVDDMLQEFTYKDDMDYIHIIELYASFTEKEWKRVYAQANLVPGGWIEQVEPSVSSISNDGSFPTDSALAKWGSMMERVADRMGKSARVRSTMKEGIEAAGFTNVQIQWYKVPLWPWAKNLVFKEAGRLFEEQVLQRMEGHTMWAMTHIGDLEVWSTEQVMLYLAKVKKDLETPGYHPYCLRKRVWAQNSSS